MASSWSRHAVPLWLASSLLVSCAHDGGDPVRAGGSSTCRAVGGDGDAVVGSDLPDDPTLPEAASGYRIGLKAVHAKTFMVATSNAHASAAGCATLLRGGSAADAAVSIEAVLGLTVPEATGLGGGGFVVYYDAARRTVETYDGRESAPAAARANDLRFIDDASDPDRPKPTPRASGRSIGTPGVPRLIEAVHKDHGKLPWRGLFDDAIRLADHGFAIGGRLAAAIASNAANLKRDPEAAAYFLAADGAPKPLGAVLRNPAYAHVLSSLAAHGADALMTGPIAADIVAKIQASTAADGAPITPGRTTAADLAGYRVKKREPVCTRYRAYTLCGMGPPSSGGIVVAAVLGIVEHVDLSARAPTSIDGEGGRPDVSAVHAITEAERLAYADRDRYVADTDYVPLPAGGIAALLDASYLASRARLIDPSTSMGTARPGDFGAPPPGVDATSIEHGTNQFTIVDGDGDVLTATTTVESSMGSFHMTHGFLLNNELTDFSPAPTDAAGVPIANRLAPGKRPRSSMAPTLVFATAADGSRGDFHLATGSPGGGVIPQYVVKALVGLLDWGLDAQQAAGLVDFGASNGPITTVGGEHPDVDTTDGGLHDPLITGLRARGHRVSTAAQSSGVNTIVRVRSAGASSLEGGTDPRREGVVLGDAAAH